MVNLYWYEWIQIIIYSLIFTAIIFYQYIKKQKTKTMEQTQTVVENNKTNQHHEKFKLFSITNGNFGKVEQFLNSGNLTPKSISITKVESNFSTVSIGYESSTASHEYELVTKRINAIGSTLEEVEKLIEKYAGELQGIVCQDIVWSQGHYIITFLTTK